jgi:hypothetical protein
VLLDSFAVAWCTELVPHSGRAVIRVSCFAIAQLSNRSVSCFAISASALVSRLLSVPDQPRPRQPGGREVSKAGGGGGAYESDGREQDEHPQVKPSTLACLCRGD